MANDSPLEGLQLALVGQCRAAVEGVIGRQLATGAATEAVGEGWSTAVTVSGAQEGELVVWFDDPGTHTLASAMLGNDDLPEPAVIADMLRQLWSQAAAALEAETDGVKLVVATPAPAPAPTVAGIPWMDAAVGFGTIVVGGELRSTRAAPVPAVADAPTAYPGNLASILEIDLPLVARFARTEMPLRALSQLGPGSLVDMGRSPDAPVQLLVGGQVIAEGEVVVVKGNYGVRITSLVSPDDRLKAIQL